jgi:membrane-bound metal-dependent hydrolase YbcI (DUF457 family)
MLVEHWIYSTAIAIIAGMLWYKYTSRDPSWLIIASAFAPDLDIVAGEVLKNLDMNVLIDGNPIRHGDFHNIAFLLLFACAAALVLRLAGMRFGDSFMFAGIGYGAHMFEDALIANPAYAFFWPLSLQKFGIGIIEYRPDWYGLANTEVLIAGLVVLTLCTGIRAAYEGKDGITRTVKTLGVAVILLSVMIPAFSVRDNFMEGGHIDKWRFTSNASRDATVFHSGSYSARIRVQGNESMKSGIWISDPFPVKPNTSYTFSAWGRTEGAGGGNGPAVRIVERDGNDLWLKQTSLIFGKGTNGWNREQITFMTLMNTSRAYVYANIWKGYGTFWFDDVELYEEGMDKNLVQNGGFEKDDYGFWVTS